MTTENYDLVIIGTGSGNSVINSEMDDWRIAIVERWTFGGTCLNRGCIPSKMLVYAADVAESAAHDNGPQYGVTTRFESADWPAIVERVFDRIDPDRRERSPRTATASRTSRCTRATPGSSASGPSK